MSNLINRVLSGLEERRNKVLKGEVNCIPLPFRRFKDEFPGIEQGTYYLISGATKSSKTQLTNYLFVYNTILYSYINKDKVKPKIFYYNLEETEEEITLRFMAFLLYTLSKIRISPTDLKSTNSDKILSEEVLDILKSDKYQNVLSYYEEVVQFMPSRNPTGIWKDIKAYAESNGTIHKKKYTYKDDFGLDKEGEAFDYYESNDPNEYVFIIIDHVSLLESERGLTLRECINKLSEYCIIFRNKYKYIPVVVQQQGMETISLDAFKNNKIRPTMAGLADSKSTGKDCTVMIGITNPYVWEVPSYLGYDVTKLKSNFRCMEIVLNRKGQSNGICPLYFDGACNFYSELPLPTDTDGLNKVYTILQDQRKKNKTFISFGINKNNKKLQNKSIFSKFAAFFNNLNKRK